MYQGERERQERVREEGSEREVGGVPGYIVL